MPEAPDLVVIREYLLPRLVGDEITGATERKPLVLRKMVGLASEGGLNFGADIADRRVESLDRRGKLLIIGIAGDRELIISPMLTGGLMWCNASAKVAASTVLIFEMKSGMHLRYFDQKKMGQVYYLSTGQRGEIIRLENQGPDVIDEPFSLDDFKLGLKPFHGEVKGVLTRRRLVSGIGNAYADEILYEARLYPFKKVTRLTAHETGLAPPSGLFRPCRSGGGPPRESRRQDTQESAGFPECARQKERRLPQVRQHDHCHHRKST